MFTIDDTVMGLLLNIQEEPDNDTPRLILSDYLQENDNENDRMYGLFIRAQVTGDIDAEPLYKFVYDMYADSLLRVTFGDVNEVDLYGGPRIFFQRGFIHAARMASAGWEMYGKLIGKYHPSVTIVRNLESPARSIWIMASGVPHSIPNEYRYPHWQKRNTDNWFENHNGYIDEEIFDLMKCKVSSTDKNIKPYPSDDEAYQALFDAYREYSGGFFVTSPNMNVVV